MAIGRFAPTPSGPLHFGSLLTALASYLDVKSRGGRWLLRMDDLDPQRSDHDTAVGIIATLERHGLISDAPCVWQSRRAPLYAQALATLRAAGQVFECTCSRKTLGEQRIYPGTCRRARIPPGPRQSTRFLAQAVMISIEDLVQGSFTQHLAHECGDFVVFRRDAVAAYHLATVVDDAAMGVTRVVRGADLLESTPRQVALAQSLGLPIPTFAHIPVVLDSQQRKASKRLAATPVAPLCETQVKCNLLWCMQLLGMSPPRPRAHSPASLLDWASRHFRLEQVPARPVCTDFVCL